MTLTNCMEGRAAKAEHRGEAVLVTCGEVRQLSLEEYGYKTKDEKSK